MKIIVCVKQTLDTETKIQLDDSGNISIDNPLYILNPYDEFAVEEAIQVKERIGRGEVTVLSVGGPKTVESLRQALAMGADRAVLVNDSSVVSGDWHSTALILAEAIKKMEYDLIMCGQVAIDDGAAQVAGRLAEILGLPQVNAITKMKIIEANKAAVVHREVEGATEVIDVVLPAVITAQRGLNKPRYPSLKGIMQAKKKEVKLMQITDLDIDPSIVGNLVAKTKIQSFFIPPVRKQGKIIQGEYQETARELVRLLKTAVKVK